MWLPLVPSPIELRFPSGLQSRHRRGHMSATPCRVEVVGGVDPPPMLERFGARPPTVAASPPGEPHVRGTPRAPSLWKDTA